MVYTLTTNEIQAIADVAAQRAVEQVGAGSKTLTFSGGCKAFGPWFREAVRTGRLAPASVGRGAKNATQRYLLSDILSLQAADKMAARLQLTEIN